MTQERHAQQGLPEFKLHDEAQHLRRGKVVRGARWLALLAVLLLLLGLGRTLFGRWAEARTLETRSKDNAALNVLVIRPTATAAETALKLPGTLQGTIEAQIYARASGYVTRWTKDIGATVRRGDLLATLDIPEVRRQVDEAQANYQLAKTAYQRWTRLRAEDAVSEQELDEKTGAYRQTEAALARLRDQLAYGQVLAPFSGIVTRRNVNVGDLVNAGSSGAPMFALAQIDKLHVYVYVPQDRAAQVKLGDRVDITQVERPDRPIAARIARTTGAIDVNSRTLQVDVEIPNPDHALLPGAYVEASLARKPSGALVLPTNTLLFGAEGVQVAVVKDGKVLRQTVVLGTDYGRVVEVRSGVTASDQVIVNPPDSIVSGQLVVVAAPQPAASRSGT
jgi:RND family efflux transporter MFP subunit